MVNNNALRKVFLPSLLLIGFLTFCGKGVETLEIGKKAPMTDRVMKDISGRSYSLKDLKKENGLAVIFTCNTCPFVKAWDDRYPGLGETAKKNKIGMVLVNPNERKRDNGDSFDDMKVFAEKNGYNTPYLLDEKAKLANSFGAKTTPHVFLFNENMELVYEGAIDDNFKDKNNVDHPYLSNAMNASAKGEKIQPQTTKATGCSIKRNEP